MAADEYPVVLFNDPDGRALLAHCPGNYCRIEFEERGNRSTAYRISRSQAVGFFPFAVGSEPPWKAATQRRVGVASAKSRGVPRCCASPCGSASP